jgi:hypothetical protein
MARYPWGLTLTPSERAYASSTPINSPRIPKRQIVHSHATTVTLPDGSDCPVLYTRYGPHLFKLDYGAPIHQRLSMDGNVDGGESMIEQYAQENAASAFRQAQEQEQKEMRRATLPKGQKLMLPPKERLDVETAKSHGGKYAVCILCASGKMMRNGKICDTPEEATEELRTADYSKVVGIGQRIAVGILNRAARQWQAPKFLIERLSFEPPTPPKPVTASEQPGAEAEPPEADPQASAPQEEQPDASVTPAKPRRQPRSKPDQKQEQQSKERTWRKRPTAPVEPAKVRTTS